MSKNKPSTDWKSLLSDSPTRPAGARLTLTVDGEEYGFRWIPPGEFEMGSPASERWRTRFETLRHVTLTEGFWLLETPVTQRLYKSVTKTNPSQFTEFTPCDVPKSFDSFVTRALENIIFDLPVENVTYDDAMNFCSTLTKSLPRGVTATLPTEAQWEYACRAGTQTPFSFGDKLKDGQANCHGDYLIDTTWKKPFIEGTSPVKTYPPNPWGLYDMHGNVWEWARGYWHEISSEPATDPTGPENGYFHVCRGGSWYDRAYDCRSARRRKTLLYRQESYMGFRILLCRNLPVERSVGGSVRRWRLVESNTDFVEFRREL